MSATARTPAAGPSSRRTGSHTTPSSRSITSGRSRGFSTPRSRRRLDRGTRITVNLPTTLVWEGDYHEIDSIEYCKPRFLELAESYTWLNPHLSLKVLWECEVKIDVKASNPTWTKWLPSWPTSAHWYDRSRLRRYMAAHIAHSGDVTVREFVREFDGMRGTAKQK